MSPSPFTIHNLPYGVASNSEAGQGGEPRLVIAYEDYAIDIQHLSATTDTFDDLPTWNAVRPTLRQSTWNDFAALPLSTRASFRQQLQTHLKSLPSNSHSSNPSFLRLSQVTLRLPLTSQNYSDFFCSYEHGKNCAEIANLKVTPNFFYIPQVYNGRTSSLAVSPTPITRPCGIFPLQKGATPTFQPENKLDFELEIGVWISTPVPRGQRLNIANAKEHIFGLTLLNDWSSRSIQFFEMQPLGPFHSKGSLTSISPWIVPIEALEDHASCAPHTSQSPSPLPPLTWRGEESKSTWNVHVSASVFRDGKEYLFSESNLNELHWTPLQQVTHLASAGEGLQTGDVFGTGTITSSRVNEKGEKTGLSCIWERNLEGNKLSSLPEDIMETLLKDGDEVVLRAWINGDDGEVLFGFGECRGEILPALDFKEWEK